MRREKRFGPQTSGVEQAAQMPPLLFVASMRRAQLLQLKAI